MLKMGQNCQKTLTNFLVWPLLNCLVPLFFESLGCFSNGIFPVDCHEKPTIFTGFPIHKKMVKTTYICSERVYKAFSSTWILLQKNVYYNVKNSSLSSANRMP